MLEVVTDANPCTHVAVSCRREIETRNQLAVDLKFLEQHAQANLCADAEDTLVVVVSTSIPEADVGTWTVERVHVVVTPHLFFEEPVCIQEEEVTSVPGGHEIVGHPLRSPIWPPKPTAGLRLFCAMDESVTERSPTSRTARPIPNRVGVGLLSFLVFTIIAILFPFLVTALKPKLVNRPDGMLLVECAIDLDRRVSKHDVQFPNCSRQLTL